MADNYDFDIKKIDHSKRFGQPENRKQKKDKKKQSAQGDEAKDHFGELIRSAERVNAVLEKNKSSCRFSIYREGNEVFIDLVILDENRKIQKTITKNVTHQEFSKIIEHIEKQDGLLLDYKI